MPLGDRPIRKLISWRNSDLAFELEIFLERHAVPGEGEKGHAHAHRRRGDGGNAQFAAAREGLAPHVDDKEIEAVDEQIGARPGTGSRLASVTPSGNFVMLISGLMSRAISASTSTLLRPRVETVAPTWRLKLAVSKTSRSAILKLATPSRARVSRCTPPTPPMPAMATVLARSACCSKSVNQPRLRLNASP